MNSTSNRKERSPMTDQSFRIALLTYSTKLRGSVVHTLELAEALHAIGHTVCVFALDKDGLGFDRSLSCDVKLITAKSSPDGIDALIQQRIQEFVAFFSQSSDRYDCYHAQDCIGANALSMLRFHQHIPQYVRTVHHIEDYNSPYLQQCQERSIRDPDLCLCVSTRWQTELQQHYQLHAPRVINGVNTQRFSAKLDGLEQSLKEQLGLHGKPLYLTVGGIEPRKNSIALLQAFSQILVDHPHAQLVIAGGATLFDYQAYRSEFFAQVDEMDMITGKNLLLPGVIPDETLPALYRLADAFVFPSVKEGWGLVVLEAIASGIPVITAKQPPFTEFLTEHQALLVDPNSPAAIAQAMRSILIPDLAHALVQNSQAILPHYAWDASARLHLVHYDELLKREGEGVGSGE